MKARLPICFVMVFVSPLLVSADGIVTLDIISDAGPHVTPGQTIEWTITAAVSTGDNQGLAMISTDLVQDAGNPELFDIPPGNRGLGMEDFDRPAGISNPGAGGSAYGGTQVGAPGEMNLAQVGGAQNTFGVAGADIGQDCVVDPGVGHGGQVIATGSFSAPATHGAYSFSLQSAVANVLDTVNPPPAWSPVSPAIIAMGSPSISFTVCVPGDLNDTQTVDLGDIEPFVGVVLDPAAASDADRCAADLDRNGTVDGGDIQPLVDALLQR